MARVLCIEDEADLAEIVAYYLRQAGHDVTLAATGREGLEAARAKHPELVLLDLMLPDTSGLDVCRALKGDPRTRSIPVVVLTAKGEEVDRIVGFELGADDYVTKPFSVRELVLRVRAILRRSAASEHTTEVVVAGPLTVDLGAHRVDVAGTEIELTNLEFRLLVTLIERRSRVQTRAQLLEEVWGLDPETSTRTVDTHVKRLREKLGEAGRFIETVRGVGYRFSTEAE